MLVKGLIWDDWNRKHLSTHNVTIEEVEEVCHGKYKVIKSYRKRIMIVGKTKSGRRLAVVLSPEDRNLNVYKEGTYYLITSYEKGV